MGKKTYIFSRDLSIEPLGDDNDSPVLIEIVHADRQKIYISLKNRLNNHYPDAFEIIGKPKSNLIISLKPGQTLPAGETITTLIHKLDTCVARVRTTLADFELIENNGNKPSLTLISKTPRISIQSFYQKLHSVKKNRGNNLLKIECDADSNTITISLNNNQHLPEDKTIRQIVEDLLAKKKPQIPYSSHLGHISNLHFAAEKSSAPIMIPSAPVAISQNNPPQPDEMIIISDDSDVDTDMDIEDDELLELEQLKNNIDCVETRIEQQEEQLSRIETQVLSLYSYFSEQSRLSRANQYPTDRRIAHSDNAVMHSSTPLTQHPTQHNFFTPPSTNVEKSYTLEQLETLFFGGSKK
ncbi:hypothetical protein [Legionella fallonii]|uniref:Uncharacterized protein n=1 Tax=Legionella fallonii LLAP-10 TaxID=1212491 RepID=A0A098G8E1_9GAMM|nr:hypothetical protein [Legionella fallonii]CEG57740.1 protein of unknown function [Legionella fallonii LLAP-10]